jgi:hypothetical protein
VALVDLMELAVALRVGGQHAQGLEVVGHAQQKQFHLLGDGPGPGLEEGHGVLGQGLAAAVDGGLADLHQLLPCVEAQDQQGQQGKEQKGCPVGHRLQWFTRRTRDAGRSRIGTVVVDAIIIFPRDECYAGSNAAGRHAQRRTKRPAFR